MSDLEKNMENLKQWIEVDINSPTTREILTNRINFHIDHPDLFSPTLYDKNKHKFSKLGQTSLEITKLSKNWSHTLTTVKAVCKFKKLLKKNNH